MEFGVAFTSRIGDYDLVALAESLGFDQAWFFDSQMIYSDVYATMAVAARETLQKEGVPTRVVSAPCIELFREQDDDYINATVGDAEVRIVIEAGVSQGWSDVIDDIRMIGRHHHGTRRRLRRALCDAHDHRQPGDIGQRFVRQARRGQPRRHQHGKGHDAGCDSEPSERASLSSITGMPSRTGKAR